MRTVVVAELVAFAGDAGVARGLVVVQIVLGRQGARHVALGEFVDVVPIVAAHQVLDLVVIPRPVGAQVHAAQNPHVVTHLVLHAGGEIVVDLVGMTLLEDVVRAVLLAGQLLQPGDVLQLGVDVLVLRIEVVEVEHTRPRHRALERLLRIEIDRLVRRLARNDLSEGVRRQVAVVVAARVGSSVPCQCRITVLAEAERRGGVQPRALGHVPRIGQHHDRLVHVAHARVAELARLITHVGIVVVVAEQGVSLVGRGLLRTALRGRSHDRKTQPVIVAEELLGRREIGIGVIVDSVHIAVPALTRSEREGVRPAVVELSGSVGDHRPEAVELVGVRHAHAESLAHLRSAGVDVGHAADAADAVIHHLQPRDILLVARRVIQAAPQRPGAVTRHGVVETDAVEHDVRILRIETADVETHLAETVRGDIAEQVLRRGELSGQRLHVGHGVIVRLGEDRSVHGGEHARRHDHHRLEVADELVAHADHHFEVLELGRRELHRIVAGRQVLEEKFTIPVRPGGEAQRFDGHLHVAQRRASVARNHLAADASLLRIGGGGHGREHQKKENFQFHTHILGCYFAM